MTAQKKQTTTTVSQPPLVLVNGIPPDLAAMKRAAVHYKVSTPAGSGEDAARELVGSLRLKMKELLKDVPKDQQLVCQNCGERSAEDVDYCPFCGDLGIDPSMPPPAEESVGISKVPSAPTADVDGALVDLQRELDGVVAKIVDLKKKADEVGQQTVVLSWDIGVLVKDVHDRQLYKARGHQTFKAFCEKELPFKRQTAYALLGVVEKFDRQTYLEVGFKKLAIIGTVPDRDAREKLIGDAKSGMQVKALDQKVKAERPARSKGVSAAPEKSKAAPAAAAAEERTVTLLKKIDGKAQQMALKGKNGSALKSWGKVTMFSADGYFELEIAPDVFLRVAPRVQGKDVVGATCEFVRAPR